MTSADRGQTVTPAGPICWRAGSCGASQTNPSQHHGHGTEILRLPIMGPRGLQNRQRRGHRKTVLHSLARQPSSCNCPWQMHNATRATTPIGHPEPKEPCPTTSDVVGRCVRWARTKSGCPNGVLRMFRPCKCVGNQRLSTHVRSGPRPSPSFPTSRILEAPLLRGSKYSSYPGGC